MICGRVTKIHDLYMGGASPGENACPIFWAPHRVSVETIYNLSRCAEWFMYFNLMTMFILPNFGFIYLFTPGTNFIKKE